MRVPEITAPGRATVVDVPEPDTPAGWVKVRVRVAPLCTEYQAFRSGEAQAPLGHEAMGEVLETRAERSPVAVGQRVVAMPLLGCGRCSLCASGDYIYCERVGNLGPHDQPPLPGSIADFIVKPPQLVVPVPDDISDEHASLACCGLGASFGAVERLAPGPEDTILVTGLGPVGLGAVVNLSFRGARVIGVEANRYRAELARRLGASHVIDPGEGDAATQLLSLTGGAGADAAIECSGAVAAHRLCISGVRRRGSVAFVGNSYDVTELVVSPDLMHRGVTLFGSWHYNLSSGPRLLEQIRQVGSKLDLLITHRFPLAEIEEAWRTQVAGRCGKVILTLGSDGAA
jgi:L-iditol 2-dehydrogenase